MDEQKPYRNIKKYIPVHRNLIFDIKIKNYCGYMIHMSQNFNFCLIVSKRIIKTFKDFTFNRLIRIE